MESRAQKREQACSREVILEAPGGQGHVDMFWRGSVTHPRSRHKHIQEGEQGCEDK